MPNRSGRKPAHPTNLATCKFDDGGTIRTEYSSPRVNGRKIFGGLLPYGKVWRTGDDKATTFVSDIDLSVGGEDVPAGRYTLFTIPGADKWTLIISKKTGEPGIPYPEGEDLLRVDMRISKTPSLIENFAISYDRTGGKCVLRMRWENTEAWVDVEEKKLCWPTTSPLTYQCPDQ